MTRRSRFVILLPLLLLLASLGVGKIHAQYIRGNEPGGPRDRDYAFCDPAYNPRELRGDYIDCTNVVTPTPGQSNQPSPTPGGGGGTGGVPTTAPTAVPTGTPSGSSSSNNDDPCASGKSYTGDYCGWSPSTSSSSGGDPGNYDPRIGGPGVAGLSYTAGEDLAPSDIILLAGVLCLLVYVKSKIEIGKNRFRTS
jgi:hypothetical protein